MSVETEERTRLELKLPPKYCVVFYNNERTSYDQVMFLLTNAFNMSMDKAIEVTKAIDGSDRGVVHVNTKEVCDMKNELVEKLRDYIQETHLKHEVVLYEEDED